jgi:hypothetical protein
LSARINAASCSGTSKPVLYVPKANLVFISIYPKFYVKFKSNCVSN